MRKRSAALALALCLIASPASAEAPVHYWPLDAERIEQVLADLGLPVGPVDGIWDHDTARATCAWRELTGREPFPGWPLVSERRTLKATSALTLAPGMRVGVNINLGCQAAVWVQRVPTEVVREVTDPTTGLITTTTVTQNRLVIERVMPVSTGMSSFPTRPGTFSVNWAVRGWWQSTIYADGKMYRPFFFDRGRALHGSSSDSLVKWYPASHGCVRMLHADIDALWDAGFGRGDMVRIYGEWKR